MCSTRSRSPSVVMFPWLAHGHISPCLELAKRLSDRNFLIYICSTPISLVSINTKIPQKYSSSIQLVELHLPPLPDLPPHYHTTNGLPLHLNPTLAEALKTAKPSFSNILNTLNPDLLIHDIVLRWAAAIAWSLNIPAVSFLTSSAAMTTYFVHRFMTRGAEYPFPAIRLKDLELAKIQQLLQRDDDERIVTPEGCPRIVLIKSSREIDGEHMDYFSNLTKMKIVPTGPLVEDPLPVVSEDDKNIELIEWLEKKDPSSSLIVSFGTEYFLSEEEVEEIAHGLELSNLNFLWVVRFPKEEKVTTLKEALPEGFLDRVKNRGIVMEGWAPQATILSHPSIGGFVSHCGWNSVMESMKLGVPIVAIPMHLDQPLNARLLVEIGVAVEVERDDNGMLHREEVAKVIREVVIEKTGEDVRRKAKEWSESLRVKGEKEIDGVVEELLQLCDKKTGK